MNKIERIIEEVKSNRRESTHVSGLCLFFPKRYSHEEVMKSFYSGLREGLFLGFERSSLEGQRIQLLNNIDNERHKEFIDKFYKLAGEYKCAIQWNERQGLCIIDVDRGI